jgi:molecular chaperone DnaK (HSP70)
MNHCQYCRRLGRTWVVSEGDTFCGLCGRSLRSISVRPEDLPRAASSSPAVMIVDHVRDAATAAFILRNEGSSTVPLERIVVRAVDVGDLSLVGPAPATLAPGEERRVSVDLGAALKDITAAGRLVTVRAMGPFVGGSLDLRLVAAPPGIVARPLATDVWSTLRTEIDAAAARESKAEAPGQDGGDRDPWRSKPVTLMIEPASGEIDVEVMPISALPVDVHVDPDSVAWAGSKGVAVTVVDSNFGRSSCRFRFRVRLDSQATAAEGTLSFELLCAGRRGVSVPVRLVAGRPAYSEQDMDTTTKVVLTKEIPSVFDLRFELVNPLAEPADLTRLVRSLHLEVQAVGVRSSTRVTQLSSEPGPFRLPVRLRFRVRITPMEVGTDVKLDFRLMARLQRREGGLDVAQLGEAVVVNAAVQSASEGERSRTRAVVDFGTTNTCVVTWELGERPGRCLALEEIGTSSNPTIIPTVVALQDSGERSRPHCIIGQQARTAEKLDNRWTVFTMFKTRIADPEAIYELPTQNGAGRHEYSAAEVTGFFLRELVLLIRKSKSQRLLWQLCLTYPTAFKAQQRHVLREVVGTLTGVGVCSTAHARSDLILDEATAGAFEDFWQLLQKHEQFLLEPRHIMVIDIGGGTSDVAVMELLPDRQPEGSVYAKVRALGLTGIRDFGGGNITRVMTDMLVAHLSSEMGKNRIHARQKGWIPLPKVPKEPGKSAGSKDEEELRVASANYDALFDFVDLVKCALFRRSAGRSGAKPEGAAEEKDIKELVNEVINSFSSERLQQYDKESGKFVGLGRAGGDVASENFVLKSFQFSPSLWDGLIEPAFRELLERARRLWDQVRPMHGGYRPPDLVMLAGGSSRIPLLRRLLSEPAAGGGLGVAAADIKPDLDGVQSERVKVKVAEGAALYLHGQSLLVGDYHLEPVDPHEYILMPLVQELAGGVVEEIFQAGYRIDAREHVAITKATKGNIEIVVFENIDQRTEIWEPGNALRGLGLSAPGKEKLAAFALDVGPTSKPEPVELRFSVEQEGYVRKLNVSCTNRDGTKQRLTEPI